jgi:hypothetical protein
MKIIKILLKISKNMSEAQLKEFLYKNLPQELLAGLEYDDPKAIALTLKMLGLKAPKKELLMEEEEG